MENIVKELLAISEDICSNYCKYPEQYKDKDEMWNEKCDSCPLNRLQ